MTEGKPLKLYFELLKQGKIYTDTHYLISNLKKVTLCIVLL